jgi:subtilisin family serine protease
MKARLWIASLLCAASLVACSSPSNPAALSVSSTYLSFPGTSTGQVAVTATGTWSATSSQTWLHVSPASASGSGNLSITVDRTGLPPGAYAGSVLVTEGSLNSVVSVYMRFPNVSGNVSGPTLAGLLTSAGVTPPGTASLPHAKGEVLVQVDPGYLRLHVTGLASGTGAPQGLAPAAVRATLESIVGDHGMTVRSMLAPNLPWAVVSTGGLSVARAAAVLGADKRVAAVEPNLIVPLAAVRPLPAAPTGPTPVTPNDPDYNPDQWDMQMLHMTSAWGLTNGSASVVVAVVDSGVMSQHPDLSANVLYPGYDFVLNQSGASTPASDANYHGTHVAGIIGAVGNNHTGITGTAWTVGLLPIRVCDASGCTLSNLIRGVEYAAGMSVYNSAGALVTPSVRANVINLSLGAPTGTAAEETAIEAAAAAGSTVVVASGNDTTNCTPTPQFGTQQSPSPVDFPAAYPDAIAVGSVDYDQGTNQYAVSCFSNTGPQLAVTAPGGWLFDNGSPVGPGSFADLSGYGADGILSTYWDPTLTAGSQGTYALDEGTSMAAPHVAGVAALMLAVNRNLSPLLVKLILENTTGAPSFDQGYGFGLIDPTQAVSFAQSNPASFATSFTVRLEQGSTVVQQVHADPGGSYSFQNVPAGTYTIVGGNDTNQTGVLGQSGEFYGTTTVTVNDTGDVTGQGLDAQLK